MRTKALLCAAAVAAGAVSAMAQTSNVYSLNVVGYVNVAIPSGYSLIANPLDAGDNSVSNLFNNLSSAPGFPGSAVYAWNGSFFAQNQLDQFGGGWANPTQSFPPGSGFFIQNVSGGPVTNTFVGTVEQGALTVPLPIGYSVVSSKVPQSGFVADLGLNATPGDAIYMWNGQYFVQIQLDQFGGGWPQVTGFTVDNVKGPLVNIGQSFFYQAVTGSTATWTRNFTVQ
jgi:hypothetical protein